MPRLGVNIDHVATVRQARRTFEPDPVWAAAMAQLGGADAITFHLREDRRHIQDRDARILRETVTVKLNFECACTPEMLKIAREIVPTDVLLVPESRQEITTEGGLDVVAKRKEIAAAIDQLHQSGIHVSLFVDPDPRQIEAAAAIRADSVELHTGPYALAKYGQEQDEQLRKFRRACEVVVQSGIGLHAGHGLTYANVRPIAQMKDIRELNIGHSIVARAIMVGMKEAVSEMKKLITTAED